TYSSALMGSKESLVKGHFSGRLIQVADIAYQRLESSFEKSLSKERFAQTQGFKTFTEYQKALGAQQLPGVVSQVRQPGVATYNVATGTYTSAEGYQSSIPFEHIPEGTKIEGFSQRPGLREGIFDTATGEKIGEYKPKAPSPYYKPSTIFPSPLAEQLLQALKDAPPGESEPYMPYITERQIGTFDPGKGRPPIPTTEVIYVDPRTQETRPATQEERNFYNQM
ncbi:hypothetical protein LCGC14_2921960, partial [marine sediment metagenome]